MSIVNLFFKHIHSCFRLCNIVDYRQAIISENRTENWCSACIRLKWFATLFCLWYPFIWFLLPIAVNIINVYHSLKYHNKLPHIWSQNITCKYIQGGIRNKWRHRDKKNTVYVNHIYDRPGYLTCERVPSNDPCLSDRVCELENECPRSNGRRSGIFVHDIIF